MQPARNNDQLRKLSMSDGRSDRPSHSLPLAWQEHELYVPSLAQPSQCYRPTDLSAATRRLYCAERAPPLDCAVVVVSLHSDSTSRYSTPSKAVAMALERIQDTYMSRHTVHVMQHTATTRAAIETDPPDGLISDMCVCCGPVRYAMRCMPNFYTATLLHCMPKICTATECIRAEPTAT